MALRRDLCYKESNLIEKEALWILCENNGIFAGKLHEIEGQYGRIAAEAKHCRLPFSRGFRAGGCAA